MAEEPRQREIRVNSTDLRYIRLAKEELGDVPLGRAAREGAKRLISDSTEDDGREVSF
jgi:hypothetical protein